MAIPAGMGGVMLFVKTLPSPYAIHTGFRTIEEGPVLDEINRYNLVCLDCGRESGINVLVRPVIYFLRCEYCGRLHRFEAYHKPPLWKTATLTEADLWKEWEG